MGKSEHASPDISLDVFFADPVARTRVVPQIQSLLIAGLSRKQIPDYAAPSSAHGLLNPLNQMDRQDYYRDLFSFTRLDRLLSPIYIAAANTGGTTAHDIRLELVASGATDGVTVMDCNDFPSVPQKTFDLLRGPVVKAFRPPDVTARRLQDRWLIQAKADKVQPESTVWFHDPIYVGADRTTQVVFDVTVFADNLATPHKQSLQLPVEASAETVTLNRIIQLEGERFEKSPAHQAFLRKHGLLDEPNN